MNKNNIANSITSDPRGRSEDLWLDTLEYLVESLSQSTSSKIEVGTYWCDDEPGSYDASIIARVRSHSQIPGVESNYWEAALCYSGSEEGGYSSADVFPFLNSFPVTSKGSLLSNEMLDEFRSWQFLDGHFVDRGWAYPDGLGEWGWIKKPGDEYPESVDVNLETKSFGLGQPIFVTLSNIIIPENLQETRLSKSRISLNQVNRDNDTTNLSCSGNSLPRSSSQDSISIAYEKIKNSEIQIDLRDFNILGGWIAGKYTVSIRIQNFHLPNEWSYTSDISGLFEFTIA